MKKKNDVRIKELCYFLFMSHCCYCVINYLETIQFFVSFPLLNPLPCTMKELNKYSLDD